MWVLTSLSLQLLLGQDDLDGWHVLGVWNRVVHDADGSDNLANHLGLVHVSNIGGVANHEWGLGGLVTGADTDDLAALHKDLIDRGVQHVGTTVNGAQTRERLGETSETVHWVQEWRATILTHGFLVELHLWEGVVGGHLQVAVITLHGDSVTKEINGVLLEAGLLEQLSAGLLGVVEVVPGLLVTKIDLLHRLVEVGKSLLLEEAHEWGLESLHLIGWHLVDDVLGRAEQTTLLCLHHVGGINTLPLEVAGDLGVEEHLDELTVGHNELGDQVHIPVSVVAVLLGWLSAWSEHRPQVGQVERGSVGTVVGVAVQVEDLLALDREQTRKNALLQTSTAHNHVVSLVHFAD